MNVLIHTWVVSYSRGSEFAITYDYIKEMSRYHHLYVVVNSCSYKLDDLSEFSNMSFDNCEWIFIEPDFWLRVLRRLEKIPDPIKGWVKYLYWDAWEKKVYKHIKRNYLNKIDIIHYLGPGGNHEAGYLWKLDKPYIWGPTNGFFNIPQCVLQNYVSNKGVFRIKNILNTISVYTDIKRRKAFRKADVIIAGMKCDANFILEKFKVNKVLYYPENTIHIYEKDILSEDKIIGKYDCLLTKNEKIIVVWCGALTSRKMPNLLLDSISTLKNKERFSFQIIGGGELLDYVNSRVEKLVELGYDVKVFGQIDRERVMQCFKEAHLHIITSAHEGNPTVVSEAMENCVPSIALHVCGMADTVTNNNGTSIQVNNYPQLVSDIANALDGYADNPQILLSKSLQLRRDLFEHTLDGKMRFFNSVYDYSVNKQNKDLLLENEVKSFQ